MHPLGFITPSTYLSQSPPPPLTDDKTSKKLLQPQSNKTRHRIPLNHRKISWNPFNPRVSRVVFTCWKRQKSAASINRGGDLPSSRRPIVMLPSNPLRMSLEVKKKANFFSLPYWSLLNALFSKKIKLAPIVSEFPCYIIPWIDCKATRCRCDNKWNELFTWGRGI